MSKLLISTVSGAGDPTRASIAFHIAANGAGATGTDCGIVLMGDATELARREISAEVRGVGIPPLVDLLRSCVERGITFYV
jgi:predicted peroxiredoxin